MAEKKNFFKNEISPAMRMVLFVGSAVLVIVLIIAGICLLQLRPNEKKQNTSGGGLDKDFPSLIGEEMIGEGSENEGFYEDFADTDISMGEIFALYEENDSYYQECTVTVFGNDGSKLERSKSILRDGDKYNIRTYNKNTLIETIKCDGKEVLIINEATGNHNKVPLSEHTDPMELASMPNHGNLTGLLSSYENEGSVLSDASFEITRSRDMNILEIKIKYKDTSMVETYRYYLNYGIIYSCESQSEDEKTKAYSMNTTYFDRNISAYVSENTFNVN